MNKVSGEPSGNVDVAAVSAGVVAVVIALFLGEGRWDLMNVVTSATLSLVIIAYTWQNAGRRPLQSFAISSVLALALLPAVGFLIEIYYSPARAELFLWNCEGSECAPGFDQMPVSRVDNLWLVVAWMVITVGGGLIDVQRQKAFKAASSAEAVPH